MLPHINCHQPAKLSACTSCLLNLVTGFTCLDVLHINGGRIGAAVVTLRRAGGLQERFPGLVAVFHKGGHDGRLYCCTLLRPHLLLAICSA